MSLSNLCVDVLIDLSSYICRSNLCVGLSIDLSSYSCQSILLPITANLIYESVYPLISLAIYLITYNYHSNLCVGLSIDLSSYTCMCHWVSHLGAMWEPFWEAFGSLRLRRHLGDMWTQFKQPLRSETLRGLFNLQFYEGFLRVGVPKYGKLQYIVVAASRRRIQMAAKAP